MKDKEIWFTYEDPNIYDGYCATVYKDGTFELRDHWAVDKLSNKQKAKLRSEILHRIREVQKGQNSELGQ